MACLHNRQSSGMTYKTTGVVMFTCILTHDFVCVVKLSCNFMDSVRAL